MSNEEKNALMASLSKLEETLKNNSPFIFAKLAPAATDQEIANLRDELGGAQIDYLETWYRWHNGCRDRTTDFLPLGRMLSIHETLADRKMIQNIPFVDKKRKISLKILEDAAGDGFFIDLSIESPRVFYYMLEDPYPKDYGTLKDFVEFISSVHAAGIATENERGMVEFDLDLYHKVKNEYLTRIGAQ